MPGFRVRIIPVLGTIPAIFGQVMASYVATQLAGLQVHMEPVVNFDMDHYEILHQRLIEHEELLYGTSMQVEVLSPELALSICLLEVIKLGAAMLILIFYFFFLWDIVCGSKHCYLYLKGINLQTDNSKTDHDVKGCEVLISVVLLQLLFFGSWMVCAVSYA